jgi:hypothetical protein
MNQIQVEAMGLHQGGYCVLPIILDGSKQPGFRWKPFKTTRPSSVPFRRAFFWPQRNAPRSP